MEGNFTSKKVISRNSSFVGLNIQFRTEAEFAYILRFWIDGIYRVHLISHTWNKLKTCSFMVDEYSFIFSLPPFQQNPCSENATQTQNDAIISKYLEQNKSFMHKQYMELIEAVRNRSSGIGKVTYCKDIFYGIQIRIIDNKYESVFTDLQVINLCKKLSTPFIRRLLINPMENLPELHFLAMKCYKKYGGYLISFILSLPVMKFGNKEGIPFIKKESHDGSISSFAIKFKNQTDEYFFVFLSRKANYR